MLRITKKGIAGVFVTAAMLVSSGCNKTPTGKPPTQEQLNLFQPHRERMNNAIWDFTFRNPNTCREAGNALKQAVAESETNLKDMEKDGVSEGWMAPERRTLKDGKDELATARKICPGDPPMR